MIKSNQVSDNLTIGGDEPQPGNQLIAYTNEQIECLFVQPDAEISRLCIHFPSSMAGAVAFIKLFLAFCASLQLSECNFWVFDS